MNIPGPAFPVIETAEIVGSFSRTISKQAFLFNKISRICIHIVLQANQSRSWCPAGPSISFLYTHTLKPFFDRFLLVEFELIL